MEKNASTGDFRISPFFYKSQNESLVISILVLMYLLGASMNMLIIGVIYLDDHLHTPMYLFVCNLSIVDICYITVIIPKLLEMLISRNNTVSFMQCFTQMYFYFISASAEVLVLFVMAYDRYVAVCNPLNYPRVLNGRVCVMIVVGLWASAFLNSFLITFPASTMSFCQVQTVHHFYCDAKTLVTISCAGKDTFNLLLYIELPLFGLVTFICSLASYVKIITVILRIRSSDGRRKAFSTCSSHLAVLTLYYVTGMSVYIIPPSKYSDILKQVCTMLYATITPIINPFIYSLRNKDITNALLKIGRAT
ncbi:olfactory receptor 1G1-like [Leptodactylus fuscus]|uniref:olfactory receptor 1G1-like n=1 Tax=Leptodactylus fuscus TaxID=238119 RepID=UPI003F4E68B6